MRECERNVIFKLEIQLIYFYFFSLESCWWICYQFVFGICI